MYSPNDPASQQLEGYKNSRKMNDETLTMSNGAPVWNKQTSLTVGSNGPMLLQDVVYLDDITHFTRERIPERVVHGKGAGAHGYFEVTQDISKYTKAALFGTVGKKTPAFVRFSLVVGQQGAADTIRDTRGFGVKFYTEEGNWDLLSNNFPVFFIRDPMLLTSLSHAISRNPVTNMRDWNAFWDFMSLHPESMHHLLMIQGDRGIPDGYRHMDGFGGHAFKLVNAEGKPIYCKFHLKSNQGNKWLKYDEAMKVGGYDSDYATRDLYNAIARGEFPEWTLYIQVMTFEQANTFEFNPFDMTKVWPHNDFPMMEVGRLVLNRNVSNHFAEVEQAAFAPSRIVPGIEFTPDRILQGRIIAYPDAQYHRLGPNFMKLPINCPYRTNVRTTQFNGLMCGDDNQDGMPTYYPNSFNGPTEAPQRFHESVWSVSGDVDRHEESPVDVYAQPAIFWNKVLDECAKKRLVENIARTLMYANAPIQKRMVDEFKKVSEELARMIEAGLKMYGDMYSSEKPMEGTEPMMTSKAGQAVKGVLEEGMKKIGMR